MIYKEAWYREALEVELQRAIKRLPSPEAFEALKKLYLRSSHLPEDVQKYLHQWCLRKVDSGTYDALDLAVVWTASNTIPNISLEAVFKTPPEYLPQMELTTYTHSRTIDLSNLNSPSGGMIHEAVRMWADEDQTEATPQHLEIIRRLEDAEQEAPDEDVASFPLNEALKIMGDRSGGWGKWYPEGAGSYRRAQEGQPLDSRYLGNYLPSHVGDPQVVWSIQYVNVVLVSRSQMDQIMDMLVSNFSKPAGIYKPLRRWLHEMDVLALGY